MTASLSKSEAQSYREEGVRLQNSGDITSAANCFQKAILLDPAYAEAYNDLGILYEASGNASEAKSVYLKAIETDPDYPNSYSNLALLYESQGNYTGAIKCWVKRVILGTSRSDPWVITAKEHLDQIINKSDDINQCLRQIEPMDDKPVTFMLNPEAPVRVTLFKDEETPPSAITNKSTAAVESLERAKEFYSRGEYVPALKEATVAEYLDPSNREISSFIEQVHELLLR